MCHQFNLLSRKPVFQHFLCYHMVLFNIIEYLTLQSQVQSIFAPAAPHIESECMKIHAFDIFTLISSPLRVHYEFT